jgi:hypothetical protein
VNELVAYPKRPTVAIVEIAVVIVAVGVCELTRADYTDCLNVRTNPELGRESGRRPQHDQCDDEGGGEARPDRRRMGRTHEPWDGCLGRASTTSRMRLRVGEALRTILEPLKMIHSSLLA